MFNNQPTQTLVHLPRQNPPPAESPLPRGECRFILPELDADGARQRCDCVSFSLNQAVPGSQCGCGHQAWHHVREPAGDYVPLDEHMALLEKFRKLEDLSRRLQDEAVKEKRDREKSLRDMQNAHYQTMVHMKTYVDNNMQSLKISTEDKLETIEDRAVGAVSEIEKWSNKMLELDEIVMRLEEKLDSPTRRSRSLTPVLESSSRSPPQRLQITAPTRSAPQLPIRTHAAHTNTDAWDVRVILVPSKFMPFAFSIDSIEFRRCQTRGLHQDLHLQDKSSRTFVQCCEASFMAIFRRRPWMPLQCLRSSDMSLGQLDKSSITPSLWDYTFLESQCMAHDKLQGDVIFIALENEELSWDEIKSLPPIFGSEESCWEYNEALDQKSKGTVAAEDRMDTDRPKADTESTFEYHSPPPYSSRASIYPDTPRQNPLQRPNPSPLDVLATASSMAPHHPFAPGAPSISERSNYSAPTIISERSVSTIGSIDSAIAHSETDSQHPSKRTKRGMFIMRSPTSPTSAHHGVGASGSSIHSAPSSPPNSTTGSQMYYSGRAKRKINPNTRPREPMDWRPSEISFKSILHRNDSRDKRPGTSSSQTPGQNAPAN